MKSTEQDHSGECAQRGFTMDPILFPHGTPVAVLAHTAARLAEKEIHRCIEPPSWGRVHLRGKNRRPEA